MADTNSLEFQAGLAAYNKQFNLDRAARIFGDYALIAFVEAYEAAKPSGWQDIASAPKDGRNVLILSVSGQAVVWWCKEEEWWMVNDNKSVDIWLRGHLPTHWKPLDFPTPPTKGEA